VRLTVRISRALLNSLAFWAVCSGAVVFGQESDGWRATRSAVRRNDSVSANPAVPVTPAEHTDFGAQASDSAERSGEAGAEPWLRTASFFRKLTGDGEPVVAPRRQLTLRSGSRTARHDWQVLPAGLLFKSYLAGEKESRMGTALLFETGGDTLQSSVLGGRIGLLRYGTPDAIRPEGWQLDVEGAAFLRQNWTHNLDVDAVDFRIGVPLTWRRGDWAAKFGYYHISSHVGDEFLLRNPGFVRRNFVRDALLFGVSHNITPDWLIYGEVGYAVHTDGGAEPWEFQFGVEYSPVERTGFKGSPFFAINGHLREEFNFGGGLNVLFGWQWRSSVTDHVLRIGGQYFNGKSLQYSFFNRHEQLIGVGIWYDF